MRLRWVLIWAVILLLSSPSWGEGGEGLQVLDLQDGCVSRIAKAHFFKAGIEFRDLENNRISVKSNSVEQVLELLESLMEELLPKGRHASLSDAIADDVLRALDQREVNYYTERFFGNRWIIWAADDNEAVNRIIRDAGRQAVR